MSQTFLEDIPEFLEIQRNSFLRILDIGLIQAFEKINPIAPTSQCKYGLLFYPKDYVLILPENTITEAFLQGKTYGCKIYVPAVIYNIENSFSSTKIGGRRFKSLKTLRFVKTTSSRFSDDTFLGFHDKSNVLPNARVEIKRFKANSKGDISRILSWECFFTMLGAIQSLSQKNKALAGSSFARPLGSKGEHHNTPRNTFANRENKVVNFISKLSNTFRCEAKDYVLSKACYVTKPNLIKSRFINFKDQNAYSSSLEQPYNQILKPTLHYLLTKVVDKKSVHALNLKTAQRTKRQLSKTIKEKLIERQKSVFYDTLPKTIRQKSKLGFFQKNPIWLRGRSNTSLIHEALNSKQLQEAGDFITVGEKKRGSKEWLLPFSKSSLINPKLKIAGSQQTQFNSPEPLYGESNNFKKNLDLGLASLTSLAKPLSRKEWVCIGVLPLMTPRGHFIINGSHRIIISQMARAPGLYYQTGEKVQATIVPSKGAWLRLSVKASDNGEIKIWVRITPQRKMPYKIFIETYKHLEISKAVLNKGGSKFLNLAYKTLNSKIKHLDKHYAVGVVSGQINRTLLNPSSYSLGALGRKRLNERLGINDKKGYLTSKDISLIKDNLLKLLGQKSTDLSADDIDHLENRRVRTCGELLQTEIETGMARLKKAIGKQLDEYSNPDSSLFNTFKSHAIENRNQNSSSIDSDVSTTQINVTTGHLGADQRDSQRDGQKSQKQIPSDFPGALTVTPTKPSNQEKPSPVDLRDNVSTIHVTKKIRNFFWLKTLYKENWELYIANPDQTLALFKEKKSGLFWKKNRNLVARRAMVWLKNLLFKKKLIALYTKHSSIEIQTHIKVLHQPKKIGITLAQARLGIENVKFLDPFKKVKENSTITDGLFSDWRFTQQKKRFSKIETKLGANLLSPSKIIGTKAFAGALREFFGSNPLSQYMDQTNPLAEITHKRRLSSLGPGGVDRASAGIAIRGIHPSHYGRICPIETPEGKNAGLVNSMTMWARVNNEGFLETPYFEVKGGSLMSHTNNLIPHWSFIPTKIESQRALKIVSSDLKITQSAFLPDIALPTRDGSERSFGREKRDYVDLCGISPMQNISVATSLIPFLEHDDATRALMGSNMQRQAVPLLKAKEPLIRTGLEGKVVGESGHALQASCSGIISTATRAVISIDSFDIIKKKVVGNVTKHDLSHPFLHSAFIYSPHLLAHSITNSKLSKDYQNLLANSHKVSPSVPFTSHNTTNRLGFSSYKKQKFIGKKKKLAFLNVTSRVNLAKSLPSYALSTNAFGQEQAFLAPSTVALLNLALLAVPNKHSKQKVIPKTLWRENSKIKRNRTIHDLQQYTRSNQATVCVQRPAVAEGRWVQKGDLIGDCSASKNGVLALGQNIVVAYLPMEGFNFEDAIVVSDRLVHEELYTSIHVQRVEFDMDALVKKHIPRKIKAKKPKSAYKTSNQDWITLNNPHLLKSEKQNLNPLGIINVGSWVGPGDVLVSKVFPVERKIAPSRHLLAAVFQEKKTKTLDTDDTSVRVPKGIHGRIINVKIVGTGKTAPLPLVQSFSALSYRKKKGQSTFSLLCETSNLSKSSSSRLALKHLPNVESAQKIDGGEVKTTLLKQSQQLNKVSATYETAFSYGNRSLELNQEELNPVFYNGHYANLLHTKEAGTPFFFLDIEARKMRITKSLIRAGATVFKEHFVLDFRTSPKAFQFSSTQKVSTFSAGVKTKNQQNLVNSKNGLNFVNIGIETNNSLYENISSTENKKKFSIKTLTDRTVLFANLKSFEQATIIAIQGLPFKLINSYSSSITNASPSLVRRVFFQGLINYATPMNKILLNLHGPKGMAKEMAKGIAKNNNNQLNSGVNSSFASAPQQNPPYPQNGLNFVNSFSLENTSLNVKEVELQASKDKNQEGAQPSLAQGEKLLHSDNLTKKNVPINSSQLKKNSIVQKSINTQQYKITGVRIYIAERKKLQVGDKMSGRHGNKGIVSTILPREDMPYLPDGTPVDMVLNPLGIPSRMNVGQVFECLLGLAASVCGESIGHTPFDEMYGPEASRSLVYLFLYVSRLRSHADWIFQPNFPGKTLLFDGRTGTPFEQWVTVGRAYMLKLIHMVDEKIHARSIGPRSLVTQQPVKGRARGGGQRLGEMEVWALEGFGAAYTLQEILTVKSDDIKGREDVESSIISATALSAHIPETFRITLFELRCLCLNLELNQNF